MKEQEIENKKAEKIVKIYNYIRYALITISIILLYFGLKAASL